MFASITAVEVIESFLPNLTDQSTDIRFDRKTASLMQDTRGDPVSLLDAFQPILHVACNGLVNGQRLVQELSHQIGKAAPLLVRQHPEASMLLWGKSDLHPMHSISHRFPPLIPYRWADRCIHSHNPTKGSRWKL